MVACSGKGSPFAVIRTGQFLSLLHVTTNSDPEKSLAVALTNYCTETVAMIYKFLVLGEKRLTIRIRATSEADARQKLNFTNPAICIARYSDKGGFYA